MRVLQLISSGGVYGAEKMLAGLARALEDRACHNIIGVFDNASLASTSVANYMRDQNLDVIEIPCKKKISWSAVRKIRDCIRAHDINVVHTHGYKADIYGRLATHNLSCGLIATSHFWTRRTRALRLYAYLDRLVLRQFDHVVAVSDAIRQEILDSAVPCDKVSALDNGIDCAPFRDSVPSLRQEMGLTNTRIVGAVGRLVKQKGFEHLIKAVPGILQTFPETMFLIVGEGDDRPRLQALTKELNVEAHVRFVGSRSDMPNVYASFDLFVLPSIDEGMPIALLEAMASAKPIVATRVAAVPKLISNRETGLLVPPGDPNSLTEAVCDLLAEPALQESLAHAARLRVEEQFSSTAMAHRYLHLYQAVQDRSLPHYRTSPCRN